MFKFKNKYDEIERLVAKLGFSFHEHYGICYWRIAIENIAIRYYPASKEWWFFNQTDGDITPEEKSWYIYSFLVKNLPEDKQEHLLFNSYLFKSEKHGKT